MSTNRRYRLFPLAEHDLEGIYDYTVENFSRRQAERYLALFFEAFEDISAGARRGRDAEMQPGVMRLLVASHIVFYRQAEEGIEIIRVLHQAMDVRRHLQP